MRLELLLTWPSFFVMGAIVGSFLNVCIVRIPREESVVRPKSHCMNCGTPIPWYLNVPIVGWLMLRGRSACCGEKISMRYLLIEALTGILFAISWQLLAPEVAICGMLFSCLLICAFFIDLDHQIIPDHFSIGGAFIGLLLSLLFPSLHIKDSASLWSIQSNITSLGNGFTGMLMTSSLLMWIAITSELFLKKETMGFGDVKLMGCIGAFCGFKTGIICIFGASILGTLFLMPLILLQNIIPHMQKHIQWGQRIPFGPFLSLSAIILFFLQHSNRFQLW